MAQISADDTKLKECGKNVIELSNKYNALMTSLFNKLEKLNSYGWSGSSADDFVRSVKLEKKQYFNLANNIKAYGSELYNVGESINNVIERID